MRADCHCDRRVLDCRASDFGCRARSVEVVPKVVRVAEELHGRRGGRESRQLEQEGQKKSSEKSFSSDWSDRSGTRGR